MAPRKSKAKSSPHPPGEVPPKPGAVTPDDLLEFPDWSGHKPHTHRIGLEAMMRLCEENLARFNSRPGAEERRLRDKCNVPFEL